MFKKQKIKSVDSVKAKVGGVISITDENGEITVVKILAILKTDKHAYSIITGNIGVNPDTSYKYIELINVKKEEQK